MAKLYIPQVGNKIKLLSNWDCKIFNEHRNAKVFKGLNVDVSNQPKSNIDITFPKGTTLRVDRLYVRAPASSYDSITFTVESSPIKSLNKARFWVKLMDANTIEFEDIVSNMDSHLKLKDLFRFVALKNNYENSEHLSSIESSEISSEIYNYFNSKNNNVIDFKFKISSIEYFQTLTLKDRFYRQEHMHQQYIDTLILIEKEFKELEVSLKMIPVLDGWIYSFVENEDSIKFDKSIGIYNETVNDYGRIKELGSYLSKNRFFTEFDKKQLPALLVKSLDKFKDVKVEYKNEIQTISTDKELTKFLKSVRIS